jgi:hypothetical protein
MPEKDVPGEPLFNYKYRCNECGKPCYFTVVCTETDSIGLFPSRCPVDKSGPENTWRKIDSKAVFS